MWRTAPTARETVIAVTTGIAGEEGGSAITMEEAEIEAEIDERWSDTRQRGTAMRTARVGRDQPTFLQSRCEVRGVRNGVVMSTTRMRVTGGIGVMGGAMVAAGRGTESTMPLAISTEGVSGGMRSILGVRHCLSLRPHKARCPPWRQ